MCSTRMKRPPLFVEALLCLDTGSLQTQDTHTYTYTGSLHRSIADTGSLQTQDTHTLQTQDTHIHARTHAGYFFLGRLLCTHPPTQPRLGISSSCGCGLCWLAALLSHTAGQSAVGADVHAVTGPCPAGA